MAQYFKKITTNPRFGDISPCLAILTVFQSRVDKAHCQMIFCLETQYFIKKHKIDVNLMQNIQIWYSVLKYKKNYQTIVYKNSNLPAWEWVELVYTIVQHNCFCFLTFGKTGTIAISTKSSIEKSKL